MIMVKMMPKMVEEADIRPPCAQIILKKLETESAGREE